MCGSVVFMSRDTTQNEATQHVVDLRDQRTGAKLGRLNKQTGELEIKTRHHGQAIVGVVNVRDILSR